MIKGVRPESVPSLGAPLARVICQSIKKGGETK